MSERYEVIPWGASWLVKNFGEIVAMRPTEQAARQVVVDLRRYGSLQADVDADRLKGKVNAWP